MNLHIAMISAIYREAEARKEQTKIVLSHTLGDQAVGVGDHPLSAPTKSLLLEYGQQLSIMDAIDDFTAPEEEKDV